MYWKLLSDMKTLMSQLPSIVTKMEFTIQGVNHIYERIEGNWVRMGE